MDTNIVNIPIGGMNLDAYPTEISPNEVSLRVNGGYGTKKYNRPGDVPDMANTIFIENLPSNIVGRAIISKRNYWVIFSINEGASEIGIANWKTKLYTKVATDKEFGCDWGFSDCEEIKIEFDYKKGCRDLVLYFSSNFIYYNINLDELINPDRKAGILKLINENKSNECQKYDCTYFHNFKCVCGIKSNLDDTGNGGYNLPAGVYQVFVRLYDRNGTPSNIFTASSQLNIGSEDNIPGQRSKSCININLSNLSCSYHIVEIILASKIGGNEKAVIVARRIYNNRQMSYTYCGKNNEEISINPAELRFRGRIGFKGGDLKIRNNKMYYYNLLPIKNPDLQKKVIEGTKVKIKPFVVPYKDVKKYQLTSLERSERYLFSLNYNTCEYGPTLSFVLAPTGGDLKYETLNFHKLIAESKSNKLPNVKYVNGKVVRIMADCKEGNLGNNSGGGCGRGSNCGLCDSEDSDNGSGGGCSGGNCLGYRSSSKEGEDSNSDNSNGQKTFTDKIIEDVENTSTSADDVANVIDCKSKECCPEGEDCCNSNCDECQCEKDHKASAEYKETIASGIKDSIIDWIDTISSYAEDGYEPTSRSASIKDAIKNLLSKTKKREQVYQNKDTVIVTKSTITKPVLSGILPDNNQGNNIVDKLNICDKTVDSFGNKVLNATVDTIIPSFPFIAHQTNNNYPDTLNCNGQPTYGRYAGQPMELFEVPPPYDIPLFLNETDIDGVPSTFRPDGEMYDQQYIVLLGLEITDIPIPTNEELGATLCQDNPVSIAMAERDFANSRVLGKGMGIGGFYGNVHGEKYLYAKHAANSPEYVDRYIDDNGSRKGIGSSNKHMFIHSLDSNIYHMGLAPTHILCEGIIKANGEKYGLCAMGQEPNDRFTGRRVDMLGARSALNFSHIDLPDMDLRKPVEIDAITYVAPDSVVNPSDFEVPIMNKGREGIVALESSRIKAMTEKLFDYSFLGITIDHRIPAKGRALYVSLLRENPDQYGTVINQSYVLLGLEGNNETYKTGKIAGMCGDVFIGLDSVRRTSYISDKVGEEYPIGGVVDGKVRSRTVCDPPDNWDFAQNGAWNPFKLPKSGDIADPKNWAGLRTSAEPLNYEQVTIDADDEGLPTNWNKWKDQNSNTDIFYFGTLTHLNLFWAETRVCPWLRQTGEGNQLETKKVFYPNLKELVLDSVFIGGSEQYGVDWNKGWLNEYHIRIEQPSRAQLARKFFYKTLINFLLPGGYAIMLSQIETSIGVASAGLITPLLAGLWTYVKLNYFTDERLNEIIGIPNCRTDAEGASTDKWIEGLQDNYWAYNWDYSEYLKIDARIGLPDPYYTCNCETETVNYIMYSSVSREGIDIDGYLSINPYNKIEIPTSAGKLKLIFENNTGFYAITSERTLVLSEPPNSIATVQGGSLMIGGASNIQEPRILYQELEEGRYGISDPNSSISTPWGQLIIVEEQRQVILFNGSFEVISDYKARRWFQKYLPFNCNGCRDEKQKYGYSAGIDYVNEMIFITKHDCECSWTIAYSVKNKWWHSFYSFLPKFYFWNKSNMFTLFEKSLWLHSDNENEFLSYYGKRNSYILEIALSKKSEGINMPFQWLSAIIDTTTRKGNMYDIMETFNRIAIYGEIVSTGQVPIRILKDSEDRVAKHVDNRLFAPAIRMANRFNINNLRNFLKDSPPLTEKCTYNEIAPVSDDHKVPEQLYADYLFMRLEYGGENELIVKSIMNKINIRLDG